MKVNSFAVLLLCTVQEVAGRRNRKNKLFEDVTDHALDVEFVHSGPTFDAFPNSPVCSTVPEDLQAECMPKAFGWLGGVAIADLNGDGWDDMYVTNGLGGANALYINKQKKNIQFKEVAMTASVQAIGDESAGAAAADVNNDGLMDLYVTNIGLGAPVPNGPPGFNKLFLNMGNDENGVPMFQDATTAANAGGNPNSRSQTVSFVDYDGDGDLDIFIAVHNTVTNPNFASDAPDYPVKRPESQQSQLLKNLLIETGTLDFQDVTSDLFRSGDVPVGQDGRPIFDSRFTFEGVWTDVDGDGDPDMLQANDLGEIGLYINQNGTSFEYQSPQAGLNDIGAWMALTVGDVNNDGLFDFFSTNVGSSTPIPTFENKLYTLYMNKPDAPGTFDEIAQTVGTDAAGGTLADPTQDGDTSGDFGWGAQWFDYDNDGDLDLIEIGNWFSQGFGVRDANVGDGGGFDFPTSFKGLGHTNRGHLFKNMGNDENGNPIMKDLMATAPGRRKVGIDNPFDAQCVVVGDFNNDGKLDVVINNVSGKASNGRAGGFKTIGDYTGRLRVFRNRSSNKNNALHIKLVGTTSNRDAIGAKVTVVREDGTRQIREVRSGEGHLGSNSPQVKFGLGKDRWAKEIIVEWPSGGTKVLQDVRIRRKFKRLTIYEDA